MKSGIKKVRMSDIAEKLGVSTVTVSKALSNKEGVSSDLRKKITQVATEMGYKMKQDRDPSDRKLTGNIGILIPVRFFSMNTSFYWYIFNFLSKELLNRNYYSIMELLETKDEQSLSLPHMVQDEKVDGVIILGQVSDKYLDYFQHQYRKFILVDFYTSSSNYDSVSDDNFYSSYVLTSYLISIGHRDMRFVGNFKATTSIRDRFMGFAKALLENDIPCTVDDIINDRDENGLYAPIVLPEKLPTTFVCNCDNTAVSLIETLQANGYSVPDDVSVTGFDNYSTCQSPVPLTTVQTRPEDTARAAADLIQKKITGQMYEKGRHLVSGSMILRASVKKLLSPSENQNLDTAF